MLIKAHNNFFNVHEQIFAIKVVETTSLISPASQLTLIVKDAQIIPYLYLQLMTLSLSLAKKTHSIFMTAVITPLCAVEICHYFSESFKEQ